MERVVASDREKLQRPGPRGKAGGVKGREKTKKESRAGERGSGKRNPAGSPFVKGRAEERSREEGGGYPI